MLAPSIHLLLNVSHISSQFPEPVPTMVASIKEKYGSLATSLTGDDLWSAEAQQEKKDTVEATREKEISSIKPLSINEHSNNLQKENKFATSSALSTPSVGNAASKVLASSFSPLFPAQRVSLSAKAQNASYSLHSSNLGNASLSPSDRAVKSSRKSLSYSSPLIRVPSSIDLSLSFPLFSLRSLPIASSELPEAQTNKSAMASTSSPASSLLACNSFFARSPTSTSILSASSTQSTELHPIHIFGAQHKLLVNYLLLSNLQMINPRSLFAPLLRVPFCITFSLKRLIFRSLLRRHINSINPSNKRQPLRVRRSSCFEDAFNMLSHMSPREMYQPLKISFKGEEGEDAGGVLREFYVVLSQQLFNPDYALFKPCVNQATFQPDPHSSVNGPSHLDYFFFAGRMVAKAICDEQLLDAHFTRSFYKHILGISVVFNDLEGVDPELFRSMKWVLDHPNIEEEELTFETTLDDFGTAKTLELKPNGKNITVTNENRYEYVRLITESRITRDIKQQIDAFVSGFYDLIPIQFVTLFDVNELELLISGLPQIDIDDMMRHTNYSNGYSANDKVIKWFWKVVREFTQEQKARLVQFITGTSKVPLGGFGNLVGIHGPQRIDITRVHFDNQRLPTAHTCFNQLELPPYSSFEILKERLLLAVSEGSEGFGFI